MYKVLFYFPVSLYMIKLHTDFLRESKKRFIKNNFSMASYYRLNSSNFILSYYFEIANKESLSEQPDIGGVPFYSPRALLDCSIISYMYYSKFDLDFLKYFKLMIFKIRKKRTKCDSLKRSRYKIQSCICAMNRNDANRT